MVKLIKSFILLLSLSILTINSKATDVRGLYIKDIDTWLSDAAYESDLLTYLQGNGYNYIVFYDLGSLNFNSNTTKNNLASFIRRAKTQYGILEVGAAGEIASFFSNSIIPYNNSRSDINDKFDVLNFEFEFWVASSISVYCNLYLTPNGYPCTVAGAFDFAKLQLQSIKALSAANGLSTEIYLGWPSVSQVRQIVPLVDRILLHSYRPNDADVYAYSRNRLIDIASLSTNIKVIPLFSSEQAFMGPWLASHLFTEPYSTYLSGYDADINSWKQYIKLSGFQWFTYTTMPKTIINPPDPCVLPAIPVITYQGSNVLTPGQTVDLYAPNSGGYLWSNGETINPITVPAGTYSVRVYSGPNCFTDSDPVTFVELRTGYWDVIRPEAMSIWPNPASNILNIKIKSESNISIYNQFGIVILNTKLKESARIHIGDMPPGAYFIMAITDKSRSTAVIIKN